MRFWFPVWLLLASVLYGFSGVGSVSGTDIHEPRPVAENKGGSVRALTDLEGHVTGTFSYDSYGVSQVGADSRAARGVKLVGIAPESLAPQAGLLRDASGSHVGYYAPLESPLQLPLLASIPLRETDLLQPSSFNLHTSYLYRGERYDPDFIRLTGKRRTDFILANAVRMFPKPRGYTWHHHEVMGIMELVRSDAHRAFGHSGGVFFWQIANLKRYP